MPDLATQLRSYLDETAAPVGFDDIFAEHNDIPLVQPTQSQPEIRAGSLRPMSPVRHRRVWAAVAAFVVVLLVGAVAWLARSSTPVDLVGEPTVTTTTTRSPTTPEAPEAASYFAAVTQSALLLSGDPTVLQLTVGPEPGFDTSALGVEMVLEPSPPEANSPRPWLNVGQVDGYGPFRVRPAGEGFCESLVKPSGSSAGCSSVMRYGMTGGSGFGSTMVMAVFVPLETSVVGIITPDGQHLWQRPIGGWGLFVIPSWPEGSPPTVDAYDALGNQIGHWSTGTPNDVTQTTPATLDQSLVSVDPRVTDVIEIGGWPSPPLVATEDAVWVADSEGATVSRIDAVTRRVTHTIPVGEGPFALLPTADAVWVATGAGTVSRIDLISREVTETIRVAGSYSMTAPLVAEGAFWVQSQEKGLVRIDLGSRQVTEEYRSPIGPGWWAEDINGAIWSFAPAHLARFDPPDREFTNNIWLSIRYSEECCIAVEDAIWLVDVDIVQRFDLVTLRITDEFDLGPGLTRGIAAAGAIWLPRSDGVLYRIDPVLREITDVIPVGSQPRQPVFADGAIWVPNQGDGTVSRIDIETRQVTHTIQVGNGPLTPLSFDGAIWVPNLKDGTVTRIQTR